MKVPSQAIIGVPLIESYFANLSHTKVRRSLQVPAKLSTNAGLTVGGKAFDFAFGSTGQQERKRWQRSVRACRENFGPIWDSLNQRRNPHDFFKLLVEKAGKDVPPVHRFRIHKLAQSETQNLAHAQAMRVMVEQITDAGHWEPHTFALPQVGVAAGPSPIKCLIPSSAGPGSNINRVVRMHEQDFHEWMDLRALCVQQDRSSRRLRTRSAIRYDKRLRKVRRLETDGVTPITIAPSTVTEALLSIGVSPGSVVLMHPDAIVAAQFPAMPNEQRLDLLIDAIEAAIGRNGTLLMPTFSYSFTKGEAFDVCRTPSSVGMLTERFRTRPGVHRTSDPIFSFACRGPLARELCAISVTECFGAEESIFATLHRLDAWIVYLGCSINQAGTFVHYVETAYGVDYRYKKTFSGTVIMPSGETVERSVVYNVRDLTRRSEADLRRLERRLADDGKSRTVEVGRSRIMAATARDHFDMAWKMLDEDPVSLIAEGAHG